VLLHQSLHHALHPEKALAEAYRIAKPGGRVVVMDLVKHRFEEARDMYADVWLGFSQVELVDLLQNAGFEAVGRFRRPSRRGSAALRNDARYCREASSTKAVIARSGLDSTFGRTSSGS
jgi:ubiquinone/menaquinone biosynthesis C-methylase UbiE